MNELWMGINLFEAKNFLQVREYVTIENNLVFKNFNPNVYEEKELDCL